MKEMKDQLHLFSQLYVTTQVKEGDMDKFFKHETQSYPPLPSKHGLIRSGDEPEFIPCLKELLGESEDQTGIPDVDGVVIEGPVIGNHLKPYKVHTFNDYELETIHPYVKRYQQKYDV